MIFGVDDSVARVTPRNGTTWDEFGQVTASLIRYFEPFLKLDARLRRTFFMTSMMARHATHGTKRDDDFPIETTTRQGTDRHKADVTGPRAVRCGLFRTWVVWFA